MLPSTPFFQKAAVDLTTGYGMDSFIQKAMPKDPWAKECFMAIVDAAINHREFYFPLPNARSVGEVGILEKPVSMALLSKVGVLVPAKQRFAENLEPSEEALQKEFTNFSIWAKRHPKRLRDWLNLHFLAYIQMIYKNRMEGNAAPFILDFWRQNQPHVEQLAQQVGVEPEKLLYAFDVMFRGLQYYRILDDEDASYFPHPIRQPLLPGPVTDYYKYSPGWSWGRLLATLIENDQIHREQEEIIQIVADLRSRVGLQGATWSDLETATEAEKKEKLTTIAAESGLPAKVRDKVIEKVGDTFSTVTAASGLLGATLLQSDSIPILLVSTTLTIGGIAAKYWRSYVPGTVGQQFSFCRGLLEWPELFN